MDFKEYRPRIKIKGDAGVWDAWSMDWTAQQAYVSRACGLEWVAFDKLQAVMWPTGFMDSLGEMVYQDDVLEEPLRHSLFIVRWGKDTGGWYLDGINTSSTSVEYINRLVRIASKHQNNHDYLNSLKRTNQLRQ